MRNGSGDGSQTPGTKDAEAGMRCFVYRSSRKDEMYLYLRVRDDFDVVPEALRRLFGPPVLAMELDLHPEMRLARVQTAQVLEGLENAGFFLQMPPAREPHIH